MYIYVTYQKVDIIENLNQLFDLDGGGAGMRRKIISTNFQIGFLTMVPKKVNKNQEN